MQIKSVFWINYVRENLQGNIYAESFTLSMHKFRKDCTCHAFAHTNYASMQKVPSTPCEYKSQIHLESGILSDSLSILKEYPGYRTHSQRNESQ